MPFSIEWTQQAWDWMRVKVIGKWTGNTWIQRPESFPVSNPTVANVEAWHYGLITNYHNAYQIGATKAVIRAPAHVSDTDARDHITAIFEDGYGNPIADGNGYPRHHIPTGR